MRLRHPRRLVLFTLVIVAGFAFYFFSGTSGNKVYEVGFVETGSVTKKISTTGRLRPLRSVLVGTEVSGQISEINVDFNSEVKKGEVLAQVDDTNYRSRVIEIEANIKRARANVDRANAALKSARVRLDSTKRDWARKKALVKEGNASQQALENAEIAYFQAEAALQGVEADVTTAGADLTAANAALGRVRLDLERTTILSPIDGIVIDRRVDAGQTVTASFQTPLLFEIAADLSRMQVIASVDESDIGEVKVGQPVEFFVDAFPREKFIGAIEQIRKAPIDENNIISYPILIGVDNRALKLLPGMTANLEITTQHKKQALRVANAALIFQPDTELKNEGISIRLATREEAAEIERQASQRDRIERKRGLSEPMVWVPSQYSLPPNPVIVRLGIEGEEYTEILNSDLRPGDRIILGYRQ